VSFKVLAFVVQHSWDRISSTFAQTVFAQTVFAQTVFAQTVFAQNGDS
jgi:hypothetical protein